MKTLIVEDDSSTRRGLEEAISVLEPLCEQLRKSDYDVGALVRTMLSSRLFFSDYAFRQKIKWPVEYVLGAARTVAGGVIPQAAPSG